MRAESLKKATHDMSSAGMQTNLIVTCLDRNGAIENLQIILPALPHAVQLLKDDGCRS